jgi:hypothetical protein
MSNFIFLLLWIIYGIALFFILLGHDIAGNSHFDFKKDKMCENSTECAGEKKD